jgi:hypothetical protein
LRRTAAERGSLALVLGARAATSYPVQELEAALPELPQGRGVLSVDMLLAGAYARGFDRRLLTGYAGRPAAGARRGAARRS